MTNHVIKPADKGGAIVIMNKDDYVKEPYRLLSDRTTYTPLDRDPLFDISRKIERLLDDKLETKIIDSHTHKFLKSEHPITPVFYFLPKIHKEFSVTRNIAIDYNILRSKYYLSPFEY